jgi:prolipoprotein diacylglyceryl transferase
MLAFLPSWTWDIDPVFFRIPRSYVIYTLVGLGVLAALYGLAKKIKDQLFTGVVLLALAWVASSFMPDPVEFRYYSMLFVVVFLGGHALLNWQIKRGGGSPDEASDFIVYGVLAVLVGARLGHVFFYDLEKALEDPSWVFKIWTGGLASHGAVIGLIVAMYLFTKRRGIPFLEGSDRFAFSAALGATVVRIGNLINSEIVGRVTDQSWGIRFPRGIDHGKDVIPLRYPSQLYEIALGTAVFIGLIIADRAMGKEKRPRGALISWFFALYFSGRFFTEFYKEFEAVDPESMLTMGQMLSLPGALLGWYGLYWAFKHKLPAGWGIDDEEREDEEDEEEEEEETDAKERDADEEQDEESDEEDEESEEEDEESDEEAEDSDEEEEEEEEKPAAKKKPASGDPDVDEEFEGGRLKREKKPVSEE